LAGLTAGREIEVLWLIAAGQHGVEMPVRAASRVRGLIPRPYPESLFNVSRRVRASGGVRSFGPLLDAPASACLCLVQHGSIRGIGRFLPIVQRDVAGILQT